MCSYLYLKLWFLPICGFWCVLTSNICIIGVFQLSPFTCFVPLLCTFLSFNVWSFSQFYYFNVIIWCVFRLSIWIYCFSASVFLAVWSSSLLFLRDYNSWRFNLVISYSEQMIQRFAFILFRVLRWYKAFFRRYSFHMLLADRLPKTLTLFIVITANTRYWANDGFMLAHPLRRWPSFVSIYRVCWDVSQG